MKSLDISEDTYNWFQNKRKVRRKKKIVGEMSEDEFLNRLLNWWDLLPSKPKIWRNLDSSAYEFIVKEKMIDGE